MTLSWSSASERLARRCGWAGAHRVGVNAVVAAASSAWPCAPGPARAGGTASPPRRRVRLSSSLTSGRCRRDAAARIPPIVAAPREWPVCVFAPAERQHQEALGDGRGDARPAGSGGRPRSRRSAAPTRVGISCSSGTGSPAATTGRRTAAAPATAARPDRRRVWAPCSNADRNIAKFSEIRVMPRPSALQRQLADHQLDGAVGGLRRTAHQVQGDAVVPHGTRDSMATTLAVAVERLDEQAVAVGGVAEPAQRHGEAALGLGVAPGVGAGDRVGHLLGRDVAVSADPHGQARPGAPGSRPGGRRAYRGPDSLKSEVCRIASSPSRRALRPASRYACAPSSWRPSRRAPSRRSGTGQPRVDGLRPGPRVADRVTAGQADADFDAVGDGGACRWARTPPTCRGGWRSSPASRSCPHSSSSPRMADSSSPVSAFSARWDRNSTIAADDQRQRAEQAEDRVERTRAGWPVNRSGVRDGEPDHPVDHVQQAVLAGERSREQLDETPGQQDPHHVAGDQHRGRLDQCAPADLGPKLPEFWAKVRRGALIKAAAALVAGMAVGILLCWGLLELFPGTLDRDDRAVRGQPGRRIRRCRCRRVHRHTRTSSSTRCSACSARWR